MGGGASQAEASASPRVLGSQSAWSEGPFQGRRGEGRGRGGQSPRWVRAAMRPWEGLGFNSRGTGTRVGPEPRRTGL